MRRLLRRDKGTKQEESERTIEKCGKQREQNTANILGSE
jgi:hypothetical protein